MAVPDDIMDTAWAAYCKVTSSPPAAVKAAIEAVWPELVMAERERIAAWLEAKAAEMGDHEIPYALQIAAQSIRNGNYERMLELQDAPGT